MKYILPALLLLLCLPELKGASRTQWTAIRSPNFEVYSHSDERDAQATLAWLERLRTFFTKANITRQTKDADSRGPVRVIGFKSVEEYKSFRPRSAADAYFLSSEARDYLVLPKLGSEENSVAAHEYAHLMLHSIEVQFRPWLAEGIAEVFSTIRIRKQECVIGGDLPMRVSELQQGAWIPLSELFSASSSLFGNRTRTNMFYAESWALTDMLVFSPKYSRRFRNLLAAMSAGHAEPERIAQICGDSLSGMWADLHAWVQIRRSGLPLAALPGVNQQMQLSVLSGFESRALLADLLLASGNLDGAEKAYSRLASEQPGNAVVHAALGTIAFRRGYVDLARQQWKRAMDLGIADATLCLRYATLAEDAGINTDEVRLALIQAVTLRPSFDDARFKLALLQNNSGHYREALEQFRAMSSVPPARAYGYWTPVSTALTRRPGSVRRRGRQPEQRLSAARLAYVAETDLTVQLSCDANGNVQMVTARKPHGSEDWNPFVEPGDHIIFFDGQIGKVECRDGKITGFRVMSASTSVEVELPDPTRVSIRGGTPEFVCGEEDRRNVSIEYAASQGQAVSSGISSRNAITLGVFGRRCGSTG